MAELDFLFGEEDFIEKMNDVVKPFLELNMLQGDFESFDGARLHYYCILNPNEKAAVAISHGFCEFNGKYHELMYYFYQMGYSVFMLEHRGHGYSHRDCENLCKVYIDSFDTYVEDFHYFIKKVLTVKAVSNRYILYAHSMGGAIGALFLEKYPDIFEKAVLSSPMMRMRFGTYPMWVVRLLLLWGKITGKHKEYVPGQHDFDNIDVFETSSAMSRGRYDYVFRMRQADEHYCTYGSTYGWTTASDKSTRMIMDRAASLKTPILLCQAGADALVIPEAQEAFSKLAPNVRLVKFDKSKHEIFNATEDIRRNYYKTVFEFMGD